MSAEPIFRSAGGAYVPTGHARGPWDPQAQHGGAPAALLAREVERLEPGADMLVARMTFEFLAPVPLAPLEVRANVARPGGRLQLVEAELFGHVKGAFTGAMATKAGRFELAQGGTLLLDEVGELSLKSQVDFLRVLETKEIRRLGGTKVVKVDARIIAATNRNLEEAVKQGQFREDLYYRLNVVPIKLPPLRERGDDIPLLVETFLREFCVQHHQDQKEVSRDTMRLLRLYAWPGNIRQLRNLIERLVVTVRDHTLQPQHLPEEIQTSKEDIRTMVVTLGTSMEEIEREVIRRTLVEVTNHREKAAKLLGISLRALQYKIKEYGIRE